MTDSTPHVEKERKIDGSQKTGGATDRGRGATDRGNREERGRRDKTESELEKKRKREGERR